MDIQEMFSILGLDETTDANLIRAAYLKKLNTVNPEDNPVGIFLHKAEEIYRSISRRIDKAEWEKLLKDYPLGSGEGMTEVYST